MIPQIVSNQLCSHPGLSREQFSMMGRTVPLPSFVLTCKCGKNKVCSVCGWNQLVGVCDCDVPHRISLHNTGESGVAIDLIFPRMG
jgi:hypothetical protein